MSDFHYYNNGREKGFVTQEEFQVVCLGLLDAQNRIAKLEAQLLAVGGGQ